MAFLACLMTISNTYLPSFAIYFEVNLRSKLSDDDDDGGDEWINLGHCHFYALGCADEDG